MWVQIIHILLAVACTLYFIFGVPESPKWSYINFLFDQARDALQYVASFNGLSDRSMTRLAKLKFDIEVLKKL